MMGIRSRFAGPLEDYAGMLLPNSMSCLACWTPGAQHPLLKAYTLHDTRYCSLIGALTLLMAITSGSLAILTVPPLLTTR